MLPDAAMIEDDTPENRTPQEDEGEVEDEEGMLPRDYQQKTAYYDYVADKQLSQADAKLFYQRSQQEGNKTGGSNWGNSQSSPQGSPVIIPRSIPNGFEATQTGVRRSDSVNSVKSSGNVLSPRLALLFCVCALINMLTLS